MAGTGHGVFETPQRIALHRCVETLPSGGPEHHAAETRKSGLCGDPSPRAFLLQGLRAWTRPRDWGQEIAHCFLAWLRC